MANVARMERGDSHPSFRDALQAQARNPFHRKTREQMDSGLALRAPRNDERTSFRPSLGHWPTWLTNSQKISSFTSD